MKNTKVRRMVGIAIMSAIVVILQLLGSFIKIGPVSISLVLIPIVVGAAMYGPTAGAVLGTSTVTTFVESASGVAAGGRTGLTALTTGVLFLASTLFAPIFTAIPSFATAPALIMVGFLMVGTVSEIRFELDNLTEAIPAYLAIIAMPLFYSISEGISLGIISYVLLNVAAGKGKTVKPLMYVLALLFVLKYIFL